jgi:hypothetical protein
MADAIPMHALVRELLSTIVYEEQGEKSAIPQEKLAHYRAVIKAKHTADPAICRHLLLAFLHFEQAGLKKLARQLLELAKIGIKENDLSQTMEQLEKHGPVDPKVVRSTALEKPKMLGVGFKKR